MSNWMSKAACAGHPRPDLFFPDKVDKYDQATAVAICGACPVRRECGEHRRATGSGWGVWAGQVHLPHRAALADEKVEPPLSMCGTWSSYKRHLEAKEVPCGLCRLAAREHERRARGRRRAAKKAKGSVA